MLRIVQFVHILEKWSQELDENFGKDKILGSKLLPYKSAWQKS